jgi:hypothetical protein
VTNYFADIFNTIKSININVIWDRNDDGKLRNSLWAACRAQWNNPLAECF